MSNADFRETLPPPSASVVHTAWQLTQQQQPEQGLKLLADLLNRDPANIDAWLMAGTILQHYGEFAQAADAYRRILAIAPGHQAARRTLGMMLITLGALAEAEPLVEEILMAEPQSADAWALLAVLRQKQVRDPEAADAFRRSLALRPNPTHHSNLLQILQYLDGITPAGLLSAHREWNTLYASPIPYSPLPTPSSLNSSRPVRLGFISADLGRHPTGFLALRPLECLDKSKCQVVCYYDRLPEDDLTARFRAASDAWRVSATWSDDQLDAQIRADKIDILFDLMGHTGHRLLVFARRPAPMQITWIGYVGTTGVDGIDFLLADRFHVPPDAEPFYTEKILRMPHDYACYGPPDDAPEISPLPALATGRVTFGCFNNAFKLSPTILDAWAHILARVPNSQLLLKNRSLAQSEVRDRLHVHFAQHGITPQRFVLEGASPHAELLATYNRVDVAIDTQPYSGGLTTCESLWMGVPVITFPGLTFAGRHSTSHLSNAGLSQFIATDLSGYIDLAVTWANRTSELAALRSQLRNQLRNSHLCNASQFATDLLSLLHQAHAAHI